MLNAKSNPSTHTSENTSTTDSAASCAIQSSISLQAGMICPRCGQAVIDYDGLLQLVCPNCGLKEVGACT
ncbi:hypothetical protein JR338_05420 [Chloroflexota bacterium]|nr:hypothetical protein JR338_05420 [Chloroflexota bacterium]